LGCYALTNIPEYTDDISSPVIPTLVMFLIGYVVSSLFMMVFDTAIDTIFLCFLVDCEHNGNGDEGYMLASKELQKLVGKYKSESKEEADKMMDPYGDKAAAAAQEDGVAKLGDGGEGGYVQQPKRSAAAAAAAADAEGVAPKAPAAAAPRPARPAAKRAAGGAAGQRRPRPGGKAAAKGGARPKPRERMVQRPLEMEVDDERPRKDQLRPMRIEL